MGEALITRKGNSSVIDTQKTTSKTYNIKCSNDGDVLWSDIMEIKDPAVIYFMYSGGTNKMFHTLYFDGEEIFTVDWWEGSFTQEEPRLKFRIFNNMFQCYYAHTSINLYGAIISTLGV